ncbi:MAG: short-chain dehydrogenase, partial [Ignavibacteria bacterium RBG_16_35_7]
MIQQNYNSPMLKEGSLEGKVILITGGGTGLGKAMGKYFLELGAKLIITSRKLKVLQKTTEEIFNVTKNEVFPFACDVSDFKQVEGLLKASIEKFGKVDVLVNNAAGNFISPTERLSNKAFDTIINIVLKGTYNCTLAFGKYWIENKQKATVLNIVTTYAWTGSAFVVPSAAAKAGVLAITRSLSVEWAKYGIRFNAIAPGLFPTKGAWERLLPGDLQNKFDLKKKIPLQRVGEHQELANLAAYLISDYSSFVNGEVVT